MSKNLCRVCGGKVKNGVAITPNYTTATEGTRYQHGSATKIISVRKCSKCGHSFIV